MMRRLPFFYGWIIVTVSALAMFFSGPGQTFAVSIFIDPIIADFGWSRSLVSSLYALGTLLAGLTMTFVGRLVDRKGYRSTLVAVAFFLACACLLMSVVQSPAMILLGFVGLRIFGQGSMTLIPYSLVPQWFVSKRGRALSFVALGIMVSSAVLPYINLQVIDAVGWRNAWRLWAVLLVVIMVPVAYFFVRNRPEDVGLHPDNEVPETTPDRPSDLDDTTSFSLQRAMRTPAFWLILLAGSVPSLVSTGITFHHMSILVSSGVAETSATGVFTVAALVAFPCTLIAGVICDRLPIRFVFSLALVVHTAVLLFYLATTSAATAIALGVLRGVDQGFLTIIGGTIWPQYFGRRHLASIRGVVAAAMVLGSALGPPIFGIAYDMFNGYSEVVYATALLPLSASIAVLFIKQPTADPAT